MLTDDAISTVGPWAKEKLDCLRKYLEAYTTIMAKQAWCRGFIFVDAFAGPGHHVIRRSDQRHRLQMDLAELTGYQAVDPGQKEYIKGSPRVALEVKRAFTKYYFTELAPQRLASLVALRDEFANARDIEIFPIDCNQFLVDHLIPHHDWNRWRAIVFLDPFGKQVPWDTIDRLSKTKAIEIFLNLPVWMAIQRFLKRHGRFTEAEEQNLDLYFGTTEWKNLLYRQTHQGDLFDSSIRHTKKVDDSGRIIVRWYRDRLKQLFPYVSSARLIKSSRGRNLYCLIHAAHKPAAGKIANEILRQGDVID